MKFLYIFGAFVLLISYQAFGINLLKMDWLYTLESITAKSSNPEVLTMVLRATRIERGVYGMTGKVTVGENYDNDVIIAGKLYRSDRGNSDYKLTPYRLPEIRLYNFMVDVYKKFKIMESVKNCSNCIQFEGNVFNGPIPAKTYEFNNCLANLDELPKHLQEGYYKIYTTIMKANYLNASVTVIFKIERNL